MRRERPEFLYHVTPARNVARIAKEGLLQAECSCIFTNVPQAVHLTDERGLPFWTTEVRDYYGSPVAVFRVSTKRLQLIDDKQGTDDAGATAYKVEHDVPVSNLERIEAPRRGGKG